MPWWIPLFGFFLSSPYLSYHKVGAVWPHFAKPNDLFACKNDLSRECVCYRYAQHPGCDHADHWDGAGMRRAPLGGGQPSGSGAGGRCASFLVSSGGADENGADENAPPASRRYCKLITAMPFGSYLAISSWHLFFFFVNCVITERGTCVAPTTKSHRT